MPTWFLVLFTLCTAFAVFRAARRIRDDETYIVGQRISRLTMVSAAVIITIALALAVAIRLGFIPNSAP
jgi:hypothetical protein